MARIQRGNRGTLHPIVELAPAGRTIRVRSANGNIDHTLVFDDTTEQIEFALTLLGLCPAVDLAKHPRMQQYARMAGTMAEDDEAEHKVRRFKEESPSGINLTGTQTGRTSCDKPNVTEVPFTPEQITAAAHGKPPSEIAKAGLTEKDVYGTGTDQTYLEAMVDGAGAWCWKVYQYDKSGEHEQIRGRSGYDFDTKDEAIEAGAVWCDDNTIDDYQTM